MYSGIIFHQGEVAEVVDQTDGGRRLRINAPTIVASLQNGSSVNIAGVCLTAADIDSEGFSVDVMPQTLKMSTASDWRVGDVVNLEPALRLGGEVGGHFVYGHVDGLAEIIEMTEQGNAVVVLLRLPSALMRYITPQGSVALDGVALTVAEVEDEVFAVSLTPETIERTTWSQRLIGDRVNFEADMLIKYLDRIAGGSFQKFQL